MISIQFGPQSPTSRFSAEMEQKRSNVCLRVTFSGVAFVTLNVYNRHKKTTIEREPFGRTSLNAWLWMPFLILHDFSKSISVWKLSKTFPTSAAFDVSFLFHLSHFYELFWDFSHSRS